MIKSIIQKNAKIDPNELSRFQNSTGIKLPNDYVDFLLKYNGGTPVPDAFPVIGFDNNPFDSIQNFFGINAFIEEYDLEKVFQGLPDHLKKFLLPIACTGGDDFVCMALSSHSINFSIVYWDRRSFWGEEVFHNKDLYIVAENFTSFLNIFDDYPTV